MWQMLRAGTARPDKNSLIVVLSYETHGALSHDRWC
jgi:hypothetical protein